MFFCGPFLFPGSAEAQRRDRRNGQPNGEEVAEDGGELLEARLLPS